MSRFRSDAMRCVALYVIGVLLMLAGVGLAALTVHSLANYHLATERRDSAPAASDNLAGTPAGQYGGLTRVVGTPSVLDPPSDPQFGLKVDTPVLIRHVDMFQWRERPLGSEVSYELAWVDHLIDASRFAQPAGHGNPASLPLTNKQFVAGRVQLGGFALAPELIRALPGSAVVPPDLKSLPANLAASFGPYQNYLTTSAQPVSPRVGDLRVSWEKIPLQPVTVFARIAGKQLVPAADAPDGKGYAIELGDVSPQASMPDAPVPPAYAMARHVAAVLLAAVGAFALLLAGNRRGDPLLALGLGALVVGASSTVLWLGHDMSAMAVWSVLTLFGAALTVWRLRRKRRANERL